MATNVRLQQDRNQIEPAGAYEPGVGFKVIVADDDPIQRIYFVRLLESLGYRPVEAEDGIEALRLVHETDAKIVISDYQMPGLTGIELTRKIRALDLGYYVHVIMITGSISAGEQAEMRAEALEAGVDDFLTKGRNPARLQARVRAATRLVEYAEDLEESHRVLKETNAMLEDDLRAAARAQRKLLPDFHEEVQGFRIASAFMPSSFVSGDMFNCFALAEDKIGFYAVDVSGHGVRASLLSVAIGHLITPEYFGNRVCNDLGLPDPALLVSDLNERFCGSDDEYFTMFCGVIDSRLGSLDYCQAAYPSAYLSTRNGLVEEVGDGGFPVGVFPFATFENRKMILPLGTTLTLCSDAVTEAENRNREPFGIARLCDVIGRETVNGPTTLTSEITAALSNWRNGQTLQDDLTILSLERRTKR